MDRGNRLTDASASPGSRELPALLHLPLGILRGFDVLQLEAEEAREGDEGGRQRREAREGDTEQRNRQRTCKPAIKLGIISATNHVQISRLMQILRRHVS